MTEQALAAKYMSVKQAAKELGLTYMAVWLRIQSGRLPSQKVGNATLVSRADVEDWRQERLDRHAS